LCFFLYEVAFVPLSLFHCPPCRWAEWISVALPFFLVIVKCSPVSEFGFFSPGALSRDFFTTGPSFLSAPPLSPKSRLYFLISPPLLQSPRCKLLSPRGPWPFLPRGSLCPLFLVVPRWATSYLSPPMKWFFNHQLTVFRDFWGVFSFSVRLDMCPLAPLCFPPSLNEWS